MKKIFYILIVFLSSFNFFANTITYVGFIDKYPIELLIQIFSDGYAKVVYSYTKYNKHIVIDGKLKKDTLILYEKDDHHQNKAIFTFYHFDVQKNKLEGTWKEINSNKEWKIILNQSLSYDYAKNIEWAEIEIIQSHVSKDHYFKTLVSKKKDLYYPSVTGLKIFDKKTNKLIQQFNDLDCHFMDNINVQLGDFNFDGIEDFSILEEVFFGSNTLSIYFLFDPNTGKYFKSEIGGISLKFDSKNKRIYETNQSQAGASIETTEYKVVKNKMVLIKKTCLKYDEEKQDLIQSICESIIE